MTNHKQPIISFILLILLIAAPLASANAVIDDAKQKCKSENVLDATRELESLIATLAASDPTSINAQLELASCYYSAGYFDKGSRLFKLLLSHSDVKPNVKANISTFIGHYKQRMNKHASVTTRFMDIKSNTQSPNLNIQDLYALLYDAPDYHRARLQLISQLIKTGRVNEVQHQLNTINPRQLSSTDYERFQYLKKQSDNRFASRRYVSGIGSYTLGHDDNVAGTANNDFYEDDHFFSAEKTGGGFSRLYASLRYNMISPAMSNGTYSHTNLNIFSLSLYDRTFFDEEGESRNYYIRDLGFTYGRNNQNNSQLLVPFSLKRIQLNEEDYAQFLDTNMRYSWQAYNMNLSLTQRLSIRDYQQFNEDRQNATQHESSFNLGMPLTDAITLNGRVDYTVLNTINEAFRSYERFTQAITATLKLTESSTFKTGFKVQDTQYQGENTLLIQPCFDEECDDEGDELIYDYLRSDELTQIFIEATTELNDHWSIKAKMDQVDRASNQDRYTYTRQTITFGIFGKF